jgi:hypothetical protein
MRALDSERVPDAIIKPTVSGHFGVRALDDMVCVPFPTPRRERRSVRAIRGSFSLDRQSPPIV